MGQKAQLASETFPATNGRCFSFWYHMYGSGIGDLNFYLKDATSTHLVKSINGDQRNRWIQGEVGLNSRLYFQVIIEAIRGTSYTGDISIDDLRLLDGNCVGLCSSVNPTTRVACGPSSVTPTTCKISYGCCYDDSVPNVPKCFQHPSACAAVPPIARSICGYTGISQHYCTKRGCCYDDTISDAMGIKCYNSLSVPTDFPTTKAPPTTAPPSIYDCTFESGLCKFKNMRGDKFDWQRHKGATGSWGTGPKADHTLGDQNGKYAHSLNSSSCDLMKMFLIK